MDTALPQKFPFILDRNLAKANCTGNRVCTSCDTVVLDPDVIFSSHTMLINASTKDFTPIHLVTYSIWRSRIRMKFYRIYSLIRL